MPCLCPTRAASRKKGGEHEQATNEDRAGLPDPADAADLDRLARRTFVLTYEQALEANIIVKV